MPSAPPPLTDRFDLPRAAFFMVGSALAFALMGAAVKVASRDVTNVMVVFFRNAVGLGLLLPWVLREGRRALATEQPGGHLVRGLAGLSAMTCFFFAIGRMRLADAILLNQSFPLFLPLAEWLWLRESMVPGVWRSLLLGFLGIVLILKPGAGVLSLVALVGLASAVLAAIAQVGIRRLTQTEPVARIVFYFGVIATGVSALALPWGWRTPSPRAWMALLATGTLATVGQLALTRAYAHAPTALVGPFIYSGVVFAAVLDWLVWETLPDASLIFGALLVTAAGASVLRREAPPEPPASGAGTST